MKLTRHPRREDGGEWYGNVEGVEQTLFLLMSERALVEIASELGKEDLARRYQMTIARRVEAMQRRCGTRRPASSTASTATATGGSCAGLPGLPALTAGAATASRGGAGAADQDPDRWWTDYRSPPSPGEPKHDPRGYWRGTCGPHDLPRGPGP